MFKNRYYILQVAILSFEERKRHQRGLGPGSTSVVIIAFRDRFAVGHLWWMYIFREGPCTPGINLFARRDVSINHEEPAIHLRMWNVRVREKTI